MIFVPAEKKGKYITECSFGRRSRVVALGAKRSSR